MYHDDTYVSVSISLPKSLKREINERALRLRMTRTDYVKALLLADLSQGPDAPFVVEYKPRPASEVEVPAGDQPLKINPPKRPRTKKA
jgi:hypothetical protein